MRSPRRPCPRAARPRASRASVPSWRRAGSRACSTPARRATSSHPYRRRSPRSRPRPEDPADEGGAGEDNASAGSPRSPPITSSAAMAGRVTTRGRSSSAAREGSTRVVALAAPTAHFDGRRPGPVASAGASATNVACRGPVCGVMCHGVTRRARGDPRETREPRPNDEFVRAENEDDDGYDPELGPPARPRAALRARPLVVGPDLTGAA